MSLYPDKVIEHSKRPKRFGRIEDADLRYEEVNPLCGDRIRVELRVNGDRQITEARFSGEMCAIAKASASILFDAVEGMKIAGIAAITDDQVLENLGGAIRSNRVKCALLPAIALRGAIRGS